MILTYKKCVVNIIYHKICKTEGMSNLNKLVKNTAMMTAVNLIMRSIAVSFNAYLTSKIGSAGMGLFQLVMTVYSLAVTLSCGGVRLAGTRVTVSASESDKLDVNKTVNKCVLYALFCGCVSALLLYFSSGFAGNILLSNSATVKPLRILAVSLPFTAMSAAYSGYFTAKGQIPQYSVILLIEQITRISVVVFLLKNPLSGSAEYSCTAIVIGMTAAETVSFLLAKGFKSLTQLRTGKAPAVSLREILRIAIPDASGTTARSLLLTLEHLLIPKGLEKSGENSTSALSAYGNIHGIALPVLLYPCAVLTSLSALIVPELAKLNECGSKSEINRTVSKNLRRTLFYSLTCAAVCFLCAPFISNIIYKSDEAVQYIRILSPLVPIMYMDTVTDGMLKGLDKQVSSMIYNLIDSGVCVILVYLLLPRYAVKGYIFILYISEILNFYLSFRKLISVCDIEIFSKRQQYFSPLKI